MLVVATGLLHADAPLENTGKPMRVAYECVEEDSGAAGITCSEDEPCPLLLELAAVEAVGSKIFISGDIHFASATLYSVLLSSEDGGRTWNEPHRRIRFGALDQIQFIDFANGWISGGNSLSGPRDPFFLITDDGGATWRQHPIFDESRPGVIDRFWFTSKSAGNMLIDARYENRHELYETNTGGNSWSMRQASAKAIPFPHSAPATAQAWRLRADGPSHSFVLEHSQGERWQRVGSFLIDIGECKM